MKRFTKISAIAITAVIVLMSSCSNKRSRGKVYMPDMAYSRTFEAYDLLDSTKFTGDVNNKGGKLIYFNQMPAPGTIKRGELFPYTLPDDSSGYTQSAGVTNPIDFMTGAEMSEAGRLYNINCGVCHGATGEANGPLAGVVGGIVNLTLDQYKQLADGTMFHVLTYGKNNMGSYASQLDKKERWMVIKYVRTLQGGSSTTSTDSTATTAKAPADSAAAKKM